jgi:hypothetical protein
MMQRNRRSWMPLATALVLSTLCGRATAADLRAVVQQPPAFGRAIADVLEQKVLLQEGDHRAALVAQPSAGRITAWLERRPSSISTDGEGRQWLVLRYQIVNAPQQLASVTIPAIRLPLTSGATLDVPDWSVTVAPLTLSQEQRPADAVASGPHRRRAASGADPALDRGVAVRHDRRSDCVRRVVALARPSRVCRVAVRTHVALAAQPRFRTRGWRRDRVAPASRCAQCKRRPRGSRAHLA